MGVKRKGVRYRGKGEGREKVEVTEGSWEVQRDEGMYSTEGRLEV